jgi:hypothetical protein
MNEQKQVLNQFLNEKLKNKKVKHYWTLTEDEKNMITDDIFFKWDLSKLTIHEYHYFLDMRIQRALEVELFEEMEILNRLKNKLNTISTITS